MTDRLDRVAIVTGAARGIGAATAIRLGAAGHAVGVIDLDEGACGDTVAAITSAGGRAVAVGADVSDGQAVTAGRGAGRRRVGRADGARQTTPACCGTTCCSR